METHKTLIEIAVISGVVRDTTDDGDGAGDVWENIISMLINVNKSNRKRITTIIQTIIFNIFHFYTYDADYNDILSETTAA